MGSYHSFFFTVINIARRLQQERNSVKLRVTSLKLATVRAYPGTISQVPYLARSLRAVAVLLPGTRIIYTWNKIETTGRLLRLLISRLRIYSVLMVTICYKYLPVYLYFNACRLLSHSHSQYPTAGTVE